MDFGPELRGQEMALQALTRARQSGRLPHGWLFVGPQGVGKAILAKRFAADLILRSDPQGRRLLESGTHPDLHFISVDNEITAGGRQVQIPIDAIRAMGNFLHMTAARGDWRLVIIDGVEHMTVNAANALLKILEEPPPQAVLILITHALGRLLPTLRSRCCHLFFSSLNAADIAAILSEQNPKLPQEERALIVRFAEGSAGRALALAASNWLQICQQFLMVMAAAGRKEKDFVALHALVDRLSAKGEEQAFNDILFFLRWWLARAARRAAGVFVPDLFGFDTDALEQEQQAEAVLSGLDAEQRAILWSEINAQIADHMYANLDRKQTLILLISHIIRAHKT